MPTVDAATAASREMRKQLREKRARDYAAEIEEMERTGTVVETNADGELVAMPMPTLKEIEVLRAKNAEEKTAAESEAAEALKNADEFEVQKASEQLDQLERQSLQLDSYERWQKGEPTLDDLETEANAAINLANEKRDWLERNAS